MTDPYSFFVDTPVSSQFQEFDPLQQVQTFNTDNIANAFPGADGKGDVSGGTDGTGWHVFNQAQSAPMTAEEQALHQRIQKGDPALMNQYKQQYGSGWLDKWGADQDRLNARATNQVADPSTLSGLKGRSGADAWSVLGSDLKNLNALRAMTPEQRSGFLNQWQPGSYDRAVIEGSLSAQGITAANGDTGVRWDGKTQNNGAMASAVPVYQRAFGENAVNTPNKVNTVPNDGTWQDRLRAGIEAHSGMSKTDIYNQGRSKNVPVDPFAAFAGDTTPPIDAAPAGGVTLSPRILTNAPPQITEGYRQFPGVSNTPAAQGGGDTFPPPDAGPPGFSAPAPQSAWSGGSMAPSSGSATRPSLSAGRFGRFAPMGASPFAQKFRQRFKPLGAPANGFTPQGGSAPSTQVF